MHMPCIAELLLGRFWRIVRLAFSTTYLFSIRLRSSIFALLTYHRGNLATESGADCFMGPNDMTPASKVMPGILAQTANVRSNGEGVLAHPMKDLRDVRLR